MSLAEGKMKANIKDITAGLSGAYFLSNGDIVQDQKGETGEVIGHSAEGNPVIMFDDGERTVDLKKEHLIKKNASRVPGHYVKPKSETMIPLATAVRIGFRKVWADTYEYREDYGTKTAEKYPWDHGSLWKTIEKDGNRFLVKEEGRKPGEPGDEYTQHQLDDPSGDPGIGNSEDSFNIFD
jgi:hypothetical protein